jgi:MFS family permease
VIAGLLSILLATMASRIVFLTSSLVFIILSVLLLFMIPKSCGHEQCPKVHPSSYLLILKNRSFLIFSIMSIFVWAIYAQLGLLLPLRAEKILNNGRLVGSIWSIMSVVVIIGQTFISRFVIQKINFIRSISLGTLIIGLGIFSIGYANHYGFLVLSAIIYVFGEMLILPSIDTLTSDLAHKDIMGSYFSIANLIYGLGLALGNYLGGRLMKTYGVYGSMKPWFILLCIAIGTSLLLLLLNQFKLIKPKLKVE